MPPRDIAVYPDLNALSRAAADAITKIAIAVADVHQKWTIALSGGSTPRALFRLLAAEYKEKIPWHQAHVYFGDERCVTPDNPDSNYRVARAELLELIPGLLSRTYRIEGELPPEEGAKKYDEALREAFAQGADEINPTFDILLLGLGTDGHTASLFPNSPTLKEMSKWAAATEAPLSMTTRHRITLTYPILNAARNTFVLAAGSDKKKIIQNILNDPKAADHYPIARITAKERLTWMIDQAANT